MSASISNNIKKSECAQTEVRTERIAYNWIIKNFKFLPQEKGKKICSPRFHDGKWRLEFYPRGEVSDETQKDDYVSLYLNHLSTREDEVYAELMILKSSTIVTKRSFTHKYIAHQNWGYENFMKRSELLSTTSDDNEFTISCIITIPLDTVTSSVETAIFDSKGGELIDDFRSLFEDPVFSDFAIIVKDKKFKTHKNILAKRCPVFAAMFEHKELEENRKNEVKIENVEPAVIHGLLEFIYTDQVTDIKELASELLAAADKYELDKLKAMCEKTLYEGLNKDNIAEILQLADLYRAAALKKCVMQYIVNHGREVIESNNWKMAGWSPELLLEVIDELILRRSVDSAESHTLEK